MAKYDVAHAVLLVLSSCNSNPNPDSFLLANENKQSCYNSKIDDLRVMATQTVATTTLS